MILPACVKHSVTRLFADDTVVYRRISSEPDAKLLQEDLDALQTWEDTCGWWNSIRRNAKWLEWRTSVILFSATYKIHGETLDTVPSAKYLGIHVDSKLNFNAHVDSVVKKANSIRAFLGRNFHHSSHKIKEATYLTYVRPIVEYAASCLGPTYPAQYKEN